MAHQLGMTNSQEMIDFVPKGEVKKRLGSSFFRGSSCNFNPYASDHQNDEFCEKFILKGLLPREKIINKETKVTAFGSCFAENITRHLSGLGFNLSKDRAPDIYISSMGEGLVNVHSLLQQFEWALTDKPPPENLWHGFDAQTFGYNETIREKTRDIFLTTDVFVITLGLSEVWYDEITGGIFWRAVPMKFYDETRHKFRVCSFAETKEALVQMHKIIRENVKDAKIVFTLSPIPLITTFRDQSCITANSASKSILRAALDEFIRVDLSNSDSGLHYFPAFEIINELFPARFVEDGRHLHEFIVPTVMKIFEAHYCETEITSHDAEQQLKAARKISAEMCKTDIRFR